MERRVSFSMPMAVDEQIVKIVVSCKVFENSLERVEVEAGVENGQNIVELVPCRAENQATSLQLDLAGQIHNRLANRDLVLEHIVYRRLNIRIRDSEDNVKPGTL